MTLRVDPKFISFSAGKIPIGHANGYLTESIALSFDTATRSLRLGDADGSNYIGFASPATVTTNISYTLPADGGSSNSALLTSGGATPTLSWSAIVLSVAGKTGAVTLVAADVTDFDTEVSNNTDVAANTTHRGRTDNPHSVTAAQVGNTTAQWNANQIQGKTVDAAAIADKKALVYHTTGDKIEYVDPYTEYPRFKYLELMGGRDGFQSNGYLRAASGGMFFNLSQFIVPFDATIIKITAACESATNEWRAEVRSNLSSSFIASLVVLISETEKVSGALSVNVAAGDKLSLYLQKGPSGDGTGINIANPNVLVIMERR